MISSLDATRPPKCYIKLISFDQMLALAPISTLSSLSSVVQWRLLCLSMRKAGRAIYLTIVAKSDVGICWKLIWRPESNIAEEGFKLQILATQQRT